MAVSEDQESEKPKTLLHKLQSSTGSPSYVYMKNQGWLVSAGFCDFVLGSEMPHACKRSNRFLPTRLDMVAGGMKHTLKLILKCLHLFLMSLFERKNADY